MVIPNLSQSMVASLTSGGLGGLPLPFGLLGGELPLELFGFGLPGGFGLMLGGRFGLRLDLDLNLVPFINF